MELRGGQHRQYPISKYLLNKELSKGGIKASDTQGIEKLVKGGIKASGTQGIEKLSERGIKASDTRREEDLSERGIKASDTRGEEELSERGIKASDTRGEEDLSERGIKASDTRGEEDLSERGIKASDTRGEATRAQPGTRSFNASSGIHFNQVSTRDCLKIWQKSFFDFNIYTDKKFSKKLDYIHTNPIKHKITNDLATYKYNSWHNYELGDHSTFKIDYLQ